MNQLRQPFRSSLYFDLLPNDVFQLVLDTVQHHEHEKWEHQRQYLTVQHINAKGRRQTVNNGIMKIQKIGFVSLGLLIAYGSMVGPTTKVGPVAWLVFGLGMAGLIVPPFQPLIDAPFELCEWYYSWRLKRAQRNG